MLGKGLESLIPPQKNNGQEPDGNQPRDINPPANLPVENSAPIDSPVNPAPPAAQPVYAETPLAPPPAERPAPREIRRPEEPRRAESVFYLEVEKIKANPNQPRRGFAEEQIKELAASIREFGVLQPIVVRKIEREVPMGTEVEYELIAGERRLRAVKLLGLATIPAIIRNVDLERERLELAVIENIQRENLSGIEMGRAFARLQDEFRMTQREIATRLGKSRETIANTLRLLDLPQKIQDAIQEGRLSESHGRLFLMLGDPAQQERMFNELMTKPMTTRELKSRVEAALPKKEDKEEESISPELKMLEDRLRSELGAPVAIRTHGESGKITIHFYSEEELKNILARLGREEGA